MKRLEPYKFIGVDLAKPKAEKTKQILIIQDSIPGKAIFDKFNELDKEIEDLRLRNNELLNCLKGLMAIVGDSDGVAGYHLNGDIAEWGEFFEEISSANDLLDSVG